MQTTMQTQLASAVQQRVGQTQQSSAFSLPLALRRPTAARPSALTCRAGQAVSLTHDAEDYWNRSYYPTRADAANLKKQWYIIDAEGQTLGRLATLAAMYIRGKNLPTYTPSMDMGAYVIVINADKVTVTGRKTSDKLYRRHTNGRPGTMKTETFQQLQNRLPEKIIEKAVYGMLPKGRLGHEIRLHLKTYKGPNHPHEAQQPIDITNRINAKPKAGALAAMGV